MGLNQSVKFVPQTERFDSEVQNPIDNQQALPSNHRMSSSLIRPVPMNTSQNGSKQYAGDPEREGLKEMSNNKVNISQDLNPGAKSGSVNTLNDTNLRKKMSESRKSMANMKKEDYKSFLIGYFTIILFFHKRKKPNNGFARFFLKS